MIQIHKYDGSAYKFHDSGPKFFPANKRLSFSEQKEHSNYVQSEAHVFLSHLRKDDVDYKCVAINHKPGAQTRTIRNPFEISNEELQYLTTTDGAIAFIFGQDFFKFSVQFDLARPSVHTTFIRPNQHPACATNMPLDTILSIVGEKQFDFVEKHARAFVSDIHESPCYSQTFQDDDLCWTYAPRRLGDLTNYGPDLFDYVNNMREDMYNKNKNLLTLIEDLHIFSQESNVVGKIRETMDDFAKITKKIKIDNSKLSPININIARILFAEYLALDKHEGKCNDFNEPPRFERARTNLELELMSTLRQFEQ